MAKRKCPYCAETVQSDAKLCRFCGKDLPQASRMKVYTGSEVATAWLTIIIAGVLFLFVGLPMVTGDTNKVSSSSKNSIQQSAASGPRVGEEGVILGGAWLATSRAIYERMNTLALAKDTTGLAAMERGGLIFYVEGSRRVRVLDVVGIMDMILEVRVLEGDAAGRSGWVLGSMVRTPSRS